MAGRGHRDISVSEIEWREGTEDGVRYARFRMDEDNPTSPSIILSTFAPGAEVPAHTHDSNYFEYILTGEQSVGKTLFRAGDIRIVKGGTGYGPIRVGADGCTVMIVFEDGSRSMSHAMPRTKPKTEE